LGLGATSGPGRRDRGSSPRVSQPSPANPRMLDATSSGGQPTARPSARQVGPWPCACQCSDTSVAARTASLDSGARRAWRRCSRAVTAALWWSMATSCPATAAAVGTWARASRTRTATSAGGRGAWAAGARAVARSRACGDLGAVPASALASAALTWLLEIPGFGVSRPCRSRRAARRTSRETSPGRTSAVRVTSGALVVVRVSPRQGSLPAMSLNLGA
jgi:hypothetical protein